MRKFVLAILTLALPFATVGASHPPGINLHNGYMIIHDRRVDPGSNHMQIYVESTSGAHFWSSFSSKGQTHVVNACCLHAGPYWLTCITGGIPGNCSGAYIHPRSCTLDGVTFHFAEVEIRGVIDYQRQWYYQTPPTWHQIDTKCPS